VYMKSILTLLLKKLYIPLDVLIIELYMQMVSLDVDKNKIKGVCILMPSHVRSIMLDFG
jgi:hypothetical protein